MKLWLKNNTAFWNSWRSKLEIKSKCTQVNGNADSVTIADNFASHFKSILSANDSMKAETIRQFFSIHVPIIMACLLLESTVRTQNLLVTW